MSDQQKANTHGKDLAQNESDLSSICTESQEGEYPAQPGAVTGYRFKASALNFPSVPRLNSNPDIPAIFASTKDNCSYKLPPTRKRKYTKRGSAQSKPSRG